MKIAYLILHYLAGADTIECTQSILDITKDSKHENIIVIVDNGSENESFIEIKEKFKLEEKVKLLHSEHNLGFAKGNNLGFVYAKNEYEVDFIVQINNDTIISQKDFSEILVEKFIESRYYVLGPDILTADGYHQNPGNKQSWGFSELLVYRMKRKIENVLYYLHLEQLQSKIAKTKVHIYNKEKLNQDKYNTILHGACLIFSPLYIERFDGLCDRTFLYWEEDLLKLYADYYGFLMLYTPLISIYHKEDVATNMTELKSNKRKIVRNQYIIKSLDIYLKEKFKIEREKNQNAIK